MPGVCRQGVDSKERKKERKKEEMLEALVSEKKLAFKTVLMDTWYATNSLMKLIDKLGKIYYCPLRRNRLVDDSSGSLEYQRVDSLSWTEK
jgi:hypothetical protein